MKRKGVVYKTCPKCGNETLRKGSVAASGKIRWTCRGPEGDRSYCYSTTNPDAPHRDRRGGRQPGDKNPQFKRKLSGIKRFVITTAQNATPLNWKFWWALQTYCRENDAELVVIPLRYKNPTSRWTASQSNEEYWLRDLAEYELADQGITRETWAREIFKRGHIADQDEWNAKLDAYVGEKYLYNQRKKLNDNLVLMGDVKLRPTAVNPLTGFDALTHGESGIMGHTKVQLKAIPTPQGKLPKIMTTTGACTVANYTDSGAGKKGEFHHTSAAVAVDIVGKKFFLYQLNAEKSGEFQHLNTVYRPDGTTDYRPVAALVFGDTHRKFMDKAVEKATFGPGGMVDTLNPEYLVFHDLHDGYAENPHHYGNPFIALAKSQAGFDDVRKEVEGDIEWLKARADDGNQRRIRIVPSNHDNMLQRWVINNDWRKDPVNAEFYLETALAMVRSTTMNESGSTTVDPFTYWVERRVYEDKRCLDIECLVPDAGFRIAGIELGYHGDKGPNGARGSRTNMKRIGAKTVIGHAHTPGIDEGCYQTGTSTPLKLEYTGGPSSWMHCHCAVYPSGKRSLLFIIDGEWRFN